MKQNLSEGQDEVEDEPYVNHLDVGGLWGITVNTDEHRGLN